MSREVINLSAHYANLGLIFSSLLGVLAFFAFIFLRPLSTRGLRNILESIILGQFFLSSFAFFKLIYAYITSDFLLSNVMQNSHQAVPLIYKITGVWGNHEGSMVLWLFLFSLFNLLSIQHKLSNKENIVVFTVEIILLSSLTAYTIITSNPFVIDLSLTKQGTGFNPLLQDVGLAIHPPILYIGFISSSIIYAFAISALFNGKISLKMLELMQKWSLFSWSFSTLGIFLGSWWAYRELGWGGYWFWDPVENASLLSWLMLTALIHSIYSTIKLKSNYKATFLLAIFAFLLSILSSFFVRSGIVTSVHSFAHSAERGLFILVLLTSYSMIALLLFASKIHKFDSKVKHKLLSRFGGINISNVIWVLGTLIILLSLIYPLVIQQYKGQQISLNEEFFQKSFIPILLLAFPILALTLPTTWKEILRVHYYDFFYSCIISILISACFYYYNHPSIISLAAFMAGMLVIIRIIFWYIRRIGNNANLKFYAICLIHLLAGLFIVTISIIETNKQEILLEMHENDKIEFVGFNIHFIKKENAANENYLAGRIILSIIKDSKEISLMKPEVRYYPVEKIQTSESYIYHNYLYDLYAVISEITKDGHVIIKFYFKPLMQLLWLILTMIFICAIILLINKSFKRA
jgi:cytochrome c-type biogenesis protein CcmF